MELNFVKMNPAVNTAIFIFDQLPHPFHGKVTQYLMKSDCHCAYQVAFIEKPKSLSAIARLQMMGGEFCGNALRALAALLFLKGYPKRYINKEERRQIFL